MKVIYDRAIFLTDEEFEEKHGYHFNVQAAAEAPVIRLSAMSGSSEEDYLHTVPDRAADLHCINGVLKRADGGCFSDKLVVFNGNLQLRWAEAGLKKVAGTVAAVGVACQRLSLTISCARCCHIFHPSKIYDAAQSRERMFAHQVVIYVHY